MADIVQYINFAIAVIFFLCYAYQFVYIFVSFFSKPKVFEDTGERKRFAFLLAARNEESVIGNLIDSILKQNYPADLIDIYVCADNSNDKTAQIARDMGILTIAVVTKPFGYEGRRRMNYALQGIEMLKESVDSLVVIPNDRIIVNYHVVANNTAFPNGNVLANYTIFAQFCGGMNHTFHLLQSFQIVCINACG